MNCKNELGSEGMENSTPARASGCNITLGFPCNESSWGSWKFKAAETTPVAWVAVWLPAVMLQAPQSLVA